MHSAPLRSIECLVAALAARTCGRGGRRCVCRMMSGERLVATVLRPLRSSVAELVPGGAVATDVLVRHGDDLKVVSVGEGTTHPENVGSMPLADIPIPEDVLAGATVVGDPGCAPTAIEAALDDWLVLTSNSLVGMAKRSLEIGVTYVNEREAFGQKIGSFQAIGHRLADDATAADGAELLGWRRPGPSRGIRAVPRPFPPWHSRSQRRRPAMSPTTSCTFTAGTASCSSTTSSSTIDVRVHGPTS